MTDEAIPNRHDALVKVDAGSLLATPDRLISRGLQLLGSHATERSSLRVIIGDSPGSGLTAWLTKLLRRIAGSEHDVVVLAGWTNEEILRHADEQRPDLFILILNNMQAYVDGAIVLSTELRGRHGVPIIAMAGSDDPRLPARAIKAGAEAFFRLPFSPADLAAAVHALGLTGEHGNRAIAKISETMSKNEHR